MFPPGSEDGAKCHPTMTVERYSKRGCNGFERGGGARLLASFDVRNITLTKTGLLFSHVDLREATVFAYRPNRVLSALDRSPHGCRQRHIFAPGNFLRRLCPLFADRTQEGRKHTGLGRTW
jgi:hypothetical protein